MPSVEQKAARPRIEFVDVAKGIAMLSIVAGHVGFVNPTAMDVLSRIVFPYHVPVFFIIAGYFLTDHQPIREFTKSKARRLLVPYILTCLFITTVVAFLSTVRGTANPPTAYATVWDSMKASLYGSGTIVPDGFQAIGAIWFLEALFVALLEMRLLLGHEIVTPAIVLTLGVGSTLAAQYHGIWLPFNIQAGFFGGVFVYAGHLMKRARLLERPWRTSTVIAIIAVLACVYAWAACNHILTYVVVAYPGEHWWGIPTSICASCLVLSFSWLTTTYAPRLKQALIFWGRNSLALLCVHMACLDCGLSSVLAWLGVPLVDPVFFFVDVTVQLALSCIFIRALAALRAKRNYRRADA